MKIGIICYPTYGGSGVVATELGLALSEKGHQIHYWTARGANSGKNWDELTVQQLNSWGVRYNSINMGKPHYDIWIDDKAINAKYFCKDIN